MSELITPKELAKRIERGEGWMPAHTVSMNAVMDLAEAIGRYEQPMTSDAELIVRLAAEMIRDLQVEVDCLVNGSP